MRRPRSAAPRMHNEKDGPCLESVPLRYDSRPGGCHTVTHRVRGSSGNDSSRLQDLTRAVSAPSPIKRTSISAARPLSTPMAPSSIVPRGQSLGEVRLMSVFTGGASPAFIVSEVPRVPVTAGTARPAGTAAADPDGRRIRSMMSERRCCARGPQNCLPIPSPHRRSARWGLSHPGRFAGAYRAAYGVPPRRTLQR